MKTEFTWESFQSRAIAVRCLTEWEAKRFLSYCQKQGFTWEIGAKIQPLKQTYFSIHGPLTCYIARADFPRIGYRSLEWACEHGYKVIDSADAIAALCKDACKPHIRFVGVVNDDNGDPEECVPIRGDVSSATARWRDAESDKPIRDGEYIVCYTKVEDCEFRRCVERVKYDLASGWDYIEDAVITHWLDGVPELPEVVVR